MPLRKAHSIGSIAQTRSITLVLGVCATTIACLTSDVIAALSVGYDLLVGALFVPVIGAILWRRGSARGALGSIAVGGIAVVSALLMKGIDSDAPIYAGLALSLVAFLTISLLGSDVRASGARTAADGS